MCVHKKLALWLSLFSQAQLLDPLSGLGLAGWLLLYMLVLCTETSKLDITTCSDFTFNTVLIMQFLRSLASVENILQTGAFSLCLSPQDMLCISACAHSSFCLSLPSTCTLCCDVDLPRVVGGAPWAGSHFLGRNQVENRFPLGVGT